jgi:hypothetical protein
VVALLVTGGSVEVAGAEVGAGAYPTSQAIAADAQFLEYAPRPDRPGVVCLVDSGVDPNPDTQGVVVGAEATVPEWGASDGLAQTLPRVDGHPNGHGTEMAMLMAAPQNGWGMVGLAPTAVHAYSIRVVPPGQGSFPFSAYAYAITRCRKLHFTTEPQMTVINLSLAGAAPPTGDDLAFLQYAVDSARQYGMNVVSAAGNDGPGTSYPAAYTPVVAVGAGDAGSDAMGASCGFSVGNGLDVTAPGCDTLTGGIDEAFVDDGAPAVGFGTSQPSALVSAAIAAMRAFSPAIGAAEAELCLTSSERPGGNLNVAAAFSDCGLSGVVSAGLAAIPAAPAPPADQVNGGAADGSSTPPTDPVPSLAEVPQPRPALVAPHLASAHLRHGVLTVRALNKPASSTFQVRVFAKRRGALHLVAARSSTLTSVTFTLKRASAVQARFVPRGDDVQASPWSKRVIT